MNLEEAADNPSAIDPASLAEREIGPVTILFGFENGKYPFGNSMLVRGEQQTAIIDPCLGVIPRAGSLPDIDLVIHSHTHEDHIAGTYLFKNKPWHAHAADGLGLESIEGLMAIYGFADGPVYDGFKHEIETRFNYPGAGDLHLFEDGHVFDLGGVQVKVIHTPGHTRGHCCLEVIWGETAADRLVYLGDIELTGFGPYYGDAWSDLEDFERSIEKLKHVDARYWLTFHHKGLVESREQFLKMLDAFASMIDKREAALLDYIEAPRTLEEIVQHRFVYRPGYEGLMVDAIEERSMSMHLDRLVRDGRVALEGDRYRALS